MGDETRNWLLHWPCQLNQDCGPTICAKWDTPEIYAFERYLAIRPTPDKRDYRKLAPGVQKGMFHKQTELKTEKSRNLLKEYA